MCNVVSGNERNTFAAVASLLAIFVLLHRISTAADYLIHRADLHQLCRALGSAPAILRGCEAGLVSAFSESARHALVRPGVPAKWRRLRWHG